VLELLWQIRQWRLPRADRVRRVALRNPAARIDEAHEGV
jgi:hypothetical protein